jgi:hypothetical protein
MIKFAQLLVMFAAGSGYIYLCETFDAPMNGYILLIVSVIPAYVLTKIGVRLADWRIRRHAAALGREHEAHDLIGRRQ